ncbi:uncharacterized protein [Cardiocondyla obscurior]
MFGSKRTCTGRCNCYIMDKDIYNRQINKKSIVSQSQSGDNHINYKIPQPIATRTKNIKESVKSNSIDYKNISLAMTGEISSDDIYRNSLTQKQSNITFVEDMEDDDEQFISNIKTIIDKNYNMQNKENFSIKDLQSKSYLAKKKKCAFSDEDQNLIKRFKSSVNKKRSSQKPQQLEHVVSVSNHDCTTIYTPQIMPIAKYNDNNVNFRKTNELFLHTGSKTVQKDNQFLIPENEKTVTKTVTEIEIEQLIVHEIHEFFTPPQKNDSS